MFGLYLGYRHWKMGRLAPRLQQAVGKPDDVVLGELVNLHCAAADRKLSEYAAGSPLRCYSASLRFFLWTAPPGQDGVQQLVVYRMAPRGEGVLLPWQRVWKASGISYCNAQVTGAEIVTRAGDGQLRLEFKLCGELAEVTGLPAEARYTAVFACGEFAKLVEKAELDVPKSGLSHPDLAWPASLLKHADALTPEVHDRLRK
jgi:hypothetical protein